MQATSRALTPGGALTPLVAVLLVFVPLLAFRAAPDVYANADAFGVAALLMIVAASLIIGVDLWARRSRWSAAVPTREWATPAAAAGLIAYGALTAAPLV